MAVPSMLYWEDPVQTGPVFGTVLVALVSLCYYSLITVLSYTFLSILVFVLLVKLYSYLMVMLKKAEPGSDPLAAVVAMPVTVPAETIAEISPCLANTINRLVQSPASVFCTILPCSCTVELRRLFLVENMVDTIKFGLSLWLLTYVGSWFNFLTLVILAWIGAFSLPKLYQQNQAQVDQVVAQITTQLEEVKAKVLALIPNKAVAAKED